MSEDLENVLAKLARSGDLKVHVGEKEDRFSLTEQGIQNAEAVIDNMLADYKEIKNSPEILKKYYKVIEK